MKYIFFVLNANNGAREKIPVKEIQHRNIIIKFKKKIVFDYYYFIRYIK